MTYKICATENNAKKINPLYGNYIAHMIRGIIAAFLFLLLFGIPSALIPTPFFSRMTIPTLFEWTIYVVTALLAGLYVGLYYFKKQQQSTQSFCAATSGSMFGFLSYGCAFCNKILIALLGISGIISYYLPYQKYFGFIGVFLLLIGLYRLAKEK